MDIMDLCSGGQVQDQFPLQEVYLFFGFPINEVSEFNSVMCDGNYLNQDSQDSRIYRRRDTSWLRIVRRRITEIFY